MLCIMLQKKTKIIATIGPATATKKRVQELSQAGVNAYRINMSHGDVKQWSEFISMIREAAPTSPIFLDTRGPEVRLFGVEEPIELAHADTLVVSNQESKNHPYFSQPLTLREDTRVLLDDGNIEAVVSNVNKELITLTITQPAVLTNRRKVSIPHTQDNLPILTNQDKKDLKQTKKLDVDGYAISFARSAQDIQEVRKHVPKNAFLIAKIENQEGVDNIEEIITDADAVMVARGDLGVEIPLQEVPLVQKTIIEKCNREAKPVIVATQMLSSMRNHNRPTRAEASDVANAILDGADCMMLSDETAMGKYPVETVKTMSEIALTMEPRLNNTTILHTQNIDTGEAMTNAAYEMSQSLQTNAIVISTSSGFTARMIARHRPKTPLIAVAHEEHIRRHLSFTWGVTPILFEHANHNGHRTIYESVKAALKKGLIHKTDTIIATAGVDLIQEGSTNLIEVHNVFELLKYHEKHS